MGEDGDPRLRGGVNDGMRSDQVGGCVTRWSSTTYDGAYRAVQSAPWGAQVPVEAEDVAEGFYPHEGEAKEGVVRRASVRFQQENKQGQATCPSRVRLDAVSAVARKPVTR